eukprot:352932-Chlamydomonas_euryale.AAC.6
MCAVDGGHVRVHAYGGFVSVWQPTHVTWGAIALYTCVCACTAVGCNVITLSPLRLFARQAVTVGDQLPRSARLRLNKAACGTRKPKKAQPEVCDFCAGTYMHSGGNPPTVAGASERVIMHPTNASSLRQSKQPSRYSSTGFTLHAYAACIRCPAGAKDAHWGECRGVGIRTGQ